MSTPWLTGKHRSMDKALRQALTRLHRREPFTKVLLGHAQSCRHHGMAIGHLEELSRTATCVRYRAFDDRGIRELVVIRRRREGE